MRHKFFGTVFSSQTRESDVNIEREDRSAGVLFREVFDTLESDDQQVKKVKFEAFLTYRKRITRLSIVQSLYIYETFLLTDSAVSSVMFVNPVPQNINGIVRSIVGFYKEVFFEDGTYGTNIKNRKLDEIFLTNIVGGVLQNIMEIDSHIKRFLKTNWTVYGLDAVVRCILRCGVYELLYEHNTERKIIVSEYVNLVRSFYNGPEVGFVNAILDNISKITRAEK